MFPMTWAYADIALFEARPNGGRIGSGETTGRTIQVVVGLMAMM